ncbi:AlpA family transcriptional regulator [Photorhabdus noenieputensis]|uniref:helix-turn-helix transcriptional regulator n=1 Tax=Photorhabdus noenieputensis TaxID=1208607 RepID=UPI001BD4024E|nr:AlpA family transcriptional regulator [Photorhabdus noenieputensis]MBS9438640.1 AlpA family transcriptional regulator [Photorhabdus noenieputensis]MCK3670954.1 AlpA family transcriptional regulator [Photorhabdus noenieputensis]
MSNKLIRLNEVLNRTGYSKSWTYKLIDKGEFPKPVKIGPRSIAFIEGEINEWIEQRINKSRCSIEDNA